MHRTKFDRDLFWKEFHSNHWEKSPLALKSTAGVGTINLSEELVFDTLVKFTECERTGQPHEATIRAFVGMSELDPNGKALIPFLPVREDKSLIGYHRRLTSKNKNLKYGIVINYVQSVDANLFETVCRELLPFVHEVGIPNGNRSCTIFLGNYDKTPFGVHIDPLSGFHFPVVGKKKLRLWSSEYKRQHPDLAFTHDYKKHLKHSTLIEADPGGMLYWPSECWHIGESDGEFHVSMGVPFYFGDRAANTVLTNAVRKSTQRTEAIEYCKKHGSFSLNNNPLEANVSQFLGTAQRQFRRMLDDLHSENTARAYWRESLRRYSAYGFEIVPAIPKQIPVSVNDVVRINTLFPFIWMRYPKPKQGYVVCCKGHSMELEDVVYVETILDTLNRGHAVVVGDLIQQVKSRHVTTDKVLAVIRSLQTLGGLESYAHQKRMAA